MEASANHLAAAYAVGALAAAQTHAFTRHLSRCAVCRAKADAFAEAASLLALALPAADPPPDLRGRILEAIRAASS